MTSTSTWFRLPTILCSRLGFVFSLIPLQPPIFLATNTLSRQEQSAPASHGSKPTSRATTHSLARVRGGELVSNPEGSFLFLALSLAGSSCAGAKYGLLRIYALIAALDSIFFLLSFSYLSFSCLERFSFLRRVPSIA